eukprot:TRINITY_DN4246_c0_g1_i1.p1 TRINITY_DN4246_c0_g1~~TRINITY_DN4246_c0_g1_i1.p1  ORF type:complete len:104 (-),score=19.25 TRINITY_DN4246_c0_g1_i1:124-435(-)
MSVNAFKRFIPLADRILVQKLKAEAKSVGGILLPDAAKQEMNQATVLAVGEGRKSAKGELIAMNVFVGQTVILPSYGGTEMKLDGENYHIYREEDIIGVMTCE